MGGVQGGSLGRTDGIQGLISLAQAEPQSAMALAEVEAGTQRLCQSESESSSVMSNSLQAPGDGETVETVSLPFLGSKITADGDCSHEIKRRLLLGRKVMTNLDSMFKSRDITLPRKVLLSRLWFFQWSCMDVRVGW